jgi:iron complex transport system substrate-binding protein
MARLAALLAAALALAAAPPAALPEAPPPAPVPQRICSVSLAGDEMLFQLVPAGRVACVSSFADDAEVSNVAGRFPAAIPRLVARTEPVIATRPDLVVAAPWNDRGFLSGLASLGVPSVTIAPAEDFAGIERALVELGRALGPEAEARARGEAAAMNARLAALDRALAAVPAAKRPRVLSLSHLVVAGSGTTVDALIRRAGGVNAAAAAGIEGHRKLAAEQILALDPDVLLLGQGLDTDAAAVLRAYPLLEATRAARGGHVILLSPRLLTTVTPYLVEGAEQLARQLHPEAFR